MEIGFDALVHHFKAEEAKKTYESVVLSDYVREHIFEPLLRDEQVLFSVLDFSRFDAGDINAIETLIEQNYEMRQRLEYLNGIFCESKPISISKHSFC